MYIFCLITWKTSLLDKTCQFLPLCQLKTELHGEFDTKMGCRDGIRGNELLQVQN